MASVPHGHFLERGKACIDCRRRKVRCDGAYPACGRCIRGGHGEDCEYITEQGKSTSQILEENIEKAETRLKQLQAARPRGHIMEGAHHEPYHGLPHGQMSVPSPNVSPHNLPLPPGWWESPNLPPQTSRMLVQIFASHASQFGFFLSGPRLLQDLFPPSGHRPSRTVSPALLSVIHLFGIHLSGIDALLARESVFLARSQLGSGIQQPQYLLDDIQAEVLLAHYFLRQCRFLEAMHHLNMAIARAVACGLHCVDGQSRSPSVQLPPARDPVQQGERIDALWTVVSLLKCWSVAPHWPCSLSVVIEEQTDVPWPLEMTDYKHGKVPNNANRVLTLKAFIDRPDLPVASRATSSLALRVKAASLFEQATYFGVKWGIDPNDREEVTQFQTVEGTLFQFLSAFPSLQSQDVDTVRNLLVTYTIGQASVIQLHNRCDNNRSRRLCLDAAYAVVDALARIPNIAQWKFINPVIGTMWVVVCHVLIRAISETEPSRHSNPSSATQYAKLTDAWKKLTATMEIFGQTCALIRFQLSRLEQTYADI